MELAPQNAEDTPERPLTITDFEAIALGQMGLTPHEFQTTQLRTFLLKLRGMNMREEQRFRSQAELVRLQTYTLINIQLGRKDRLSNPRQLWQFTWESDEAPETPSLTPEQQKERFAKMINVLNKSNN